MRMMIAAVCAGALLVSVGAHAQTAVAPAPAPAPVVVGMTDSMMRVGTKVPLKLSEELTTKGKKLHGGQHFQLETTEPVLVDGTIVVPAGTPAVGEITDVRNKGMWGRSGHLGAQLLYLTINGRQVKLTGTFDDKGTAGGIGAAAVSAVVFLPAGFFMTGTSARLPIGTPVTGFIGEDVPLTFAAPTAKPLVVPATAPAPTATATPTMTPVSATKR